MPHSVEHATIKLATVLPWILTVGLLAVSGYAASVGSDIEKVTEVTKENAKQIQANIQAIGLLIQTTGQTQETVKTAAKDARTNGETLIRIEEQIKALKPAAPP